MNKLILKIDKQAVSYRTFEAERHGCFSHCCSVLAVSRSMAETPCKQFDKNRHSDVLLIFFFSFPPCTWSYWHATLFSFCFFEGAFFNLLLFGDCDRAFRLGLIMPECLVVIFDQLYLLFVYSEVLCFYF